MTFKPKGTNNLASQLAASNTSLVATKTPQQEEAEKANKTIKELPSFTPAEIATERIRIIFDDSGSMGGGKIKDARDGCIEFMRNCKINETACAVHTMNNQRDNGLIDLTRLTTNLPALSILISKIKDVGSTPLFTTLEQAQHEEPKATRYIVFSDGAPDSYDVDRYKEITILLAIENKTPVDTVLISYGDSYYHSTSQEDQKEYILLKELADRTGGYFLVFDRNKVDFKKAFKYLAPSLRASLSDGKIRLALQAGELK